MEFAVIVLSLVVSSCLALVLWIRYKHNYWRRRHIATESLSDIYKRRIHPALTLQQIYEKLKIANKPYTALYNLFSPTLLISDLDLLKIIYVSEFQSFPDRGLYANYAHDPLSKNLLRLHGDLWKKVRAKVTPTFTSGKIKMMFSTTVEIGQRFVEVTRENMLHHQDSEVEIKDICARFTTDIIGRVAFGLDCNSLRHPHTEFRVMGDKAFYTIHPLVDALACEYPKIFNFLGLKVFTKELIEFYSRIVKESIDYRQKNRIECNDFLDILIDLMKRENESTNDFRLDMDDVIAQAFVFLIGGFETSSSTMSYAIFELAHNSVVQQTARDNIKQTLAKHNGELTYECLQDMSYIKQVVQETLRKYPVAPTGKRICRQSITLPAPANLTIHPGEHILAPVYAIHNDPEYYPEPEVFQPERFTAEEKEHRHPMAYLPFGAGPRMCIAERFGMMTTMLGVALLIENFSFSPCSKTPTTLIFDPTNIRVFSVKDGLYFRVEKV